MEFKDYYQILGVEEEATSQDIKRAHRKLARKYHPDVSELPDAEERFKEIQEAYEVLKDPESAPPMINLVPVMSLDSPLRHPMIGSRRLGFRAAAIHKQTRRISVSFFPRCSAVAGAHHTTVIHFQGAPIADRTSMRA